MFSSFIGNQFNILFYNSAALCYHFNSIEEFLNQPINPNNLLKAIKRNISNSLFLEEEPAFGIFDELVTRPVWRLTETKNIFWRSANIYFN